MVDPSATEATKNLYIFLQESSKTKFLFGYHDSLGYGVNWKNKTEPEWTNDLYKVYGVNPKMFSWDLGSGSVDYEIDNWPLNGVSNADIVEYVKYAHKIGGINTICMHRKNPKTGGKFYDTTSVIPDLLVSGELQTDYLEWLTEIADVFKSMVDDEGELIPVIFRPYHEHNGDWFWWGNASRTMDEYNEFWRMTVEHLRDICQVHNLIYAISPDSQFIYATWEYYELNSENYDTVIEKYQDSGYPGHDYVDIIAMDSYSLWDEWYVSRMSTSYRDVCHWARQNGKACAIAETGSDRMEISRFYPDYVYEAVTRHDSGMAYVMGWRNANEGHYYVPWPGANEADKSSFQEFLDKNDVGML